MPQRGDKQLCDSRSTRVVVDGSSEFLCSDDSEVAYHTARIIELGLN